MQSNLFGNKVILPVIAGIMISSTSYSIAEDSERKFFQLETITVTAEKSEADKQDVPSNVSVYEGTDLEDFTITDLEGVAAITPNVNSLNMDSHYKPLIYRGIGGLTNMNKVWAVNVDGVTLPYVAADTFLDIERVELLRGSQGALYGRNTHAGLVNIITRGPGNYFSGYADFSYESFDTMKFNTALGGPVGKDDGYRLAFGYRKTDGYHENTYLGIDNGNDDEQFSGRGKYALNTPGAGKLIFSVIADSYEGGFDSYTLDGGTNTTNNVPGYTDGYLISPTLTWEKVFDNYSITSITNYSRSNYGFLHDWDFSSADLYTGEYDEIFDTFTQEIRLDGETSFGMKWLGGAFFLSESLDSKTDVVFGNDGWMYGMPTGAYQAQQSTIDTLSSALFGQALYRLSQKIEVTGRLRLDYESKDLDWTGSSNMYADIKKSFDQDWFAALPSASVAWLLQEDQRLYGSISRGYKAGDYNNVQVDTSVVTEAVDPEYTITYEAGYKGLLADKRLELNLALFYIDWTDMQVETPVSYQGTLVYVKQNAAEAHSSGVEIELRALLARDWNVFMGASYMFEYEFDAFPNSTAGNLTGKKLPGTSNFSLSGGVIYRHPEGFFTSLDASVKGPRYFDEANLFEQKSYTLVNAKIGYEADTWSFYLYGKNLFDEEYTVAMFAGAEMAGEPLVVGAQFQYKF